MWLDVQTFAKKSKKGGWKHVGAEIVEKHIGAKAFTLMKNVACKQTD